jgi:hypothetical protein
LLYPQRCGYYCRQGGNDDMKKNPAAVALGRLGGSKATEAQKAAARINGLKGGRPKHLRGGRPQKAEVKS